MKTKRLVSLISTLCLCCGMLVTSFSALPTFGNTEPAVEMIEASAETNNYDSLEMTNGYYRFVQGSRVGNLRQLESGEVMMDLSFVFEVLDTSNFKVGNSADGEYEIYQFTVIRDSEQGQIPVASIGIISTDVAIAVGHKQIASTTAGATGTALKDNAIELEPNQMDKSGFYYEYEDGKVYFTGTKDGKYYNHKLDSSQEVPNFDKWLPGYTIDYMVRNNDKTAFYTETKDLTFPTLYLNVSMNSIYSSYFMVADVYQRRFTGYKTEGILWWKKQVPQYAERTLPMIRSQSRSVKQVLDNIQAAGKIEEEFPDENVRAVVNEILDTTETKLITVKYLKQIGNTPFARAISTTVNVLTHNDKVYYDDVCDAVGEKTLSCMGSTVKYFKKNSLNVYEAIYLSSINMKSLTEDGHYADYYIGLGQSFNKFIDDFNGNDIFDPGLFEFMLNDIHVVYPATEPYNGDELYGFWGSFVIPETLNMNTVWANFFQVDAGTTGIGKSYEVVPTMSVGEYWNALANHDYNWAQSLFQVVANGLTNWFELKGKYVVYYAKSYVTSGGYNEGGSANPEDSQGAIVDGMTGAVGEIIDAFKEFIQTEKNNQMNETVRTVLILVGAMLGLMIIGGVVTFIIVRKEKKKR